MSEVAGEREARASPTASAASRFDAFISYSRAADGRLAPALQGGLQQFAKPWYRLRALRVFRDDASLSANPGLWPSISGALDESEFFLLLASPAAARSEWVEKEVEHWLSQKGPSRLLLVLTDGDIAWDDAAADFDWTRTDSLPRVLEGAFEHEPRFVDLRWARAAVDVSLRNPRFREAVADLAAPLHARPKDELIGEDVRQHRRALRLARSAAAGLLALAAAAAVFAFLAAGQRDRARAERREAVAQARLAHSRELAARAELELSLDPARSLRLALQAIDLTRSKQALDALRAALLRSHARFVLPVGSEVDDAQFSRDGRFLLTSSADEAEVHVWSLTDGKLAGMLGHGRACQSPDGRIVVTIGGGEAVVWDLPTRRRLAKLAGADLDTASCAFAPDGRMIALPGTGGTERVWEARTGRRVAVLRGGRGGFAGGAFTDDGRFFVASTRTAGAARAWTVPGWRPVPSPKELIRRASLSDGAELTAVTAGAGKADVYERRTGGPVVTLHDSSFGGARGWPVSISRDRRLLGSVDGEGFPALWDARTGKKLVRLGARGSQSWSVVVSADGRVAATEDGTTVELWAVAGPAAIGELVGHNGFLGGIAFSHDDRLVVTWSDDGTARVWSVPGSTTATLPGAIVAAAVTGRRMVAATSSKRGVQIWRGALPEGGALRLQKGPLIRGSVYDPEMSPDGALLAAGAAPGVEIWDTRTGRRVASLRAPADKVAFSPDGTTVATATFDGRLAIWQARSGRKLAAGRYRTEGSDVYGLGVGPRGTRVGLTDGEGRLVLWQPFRKRFRTLMGQDANQVWFSPDGRRILTNGPRRSAILMDADGKRLHRLTPGFAFARPFSADGRLLALQSESRELAVWDAESGQRLARFAGSADGFERVMFDRAGTTVVSAADLSNEIRVQACEACLPVADLIALARRRDRIARRDPAPPGSR